MISNQREVNNQRDRSQIGQTLRQTDRDFTEPDREGGGIVRRERERKRERGGEVAERGGGGEYTQAGRQTAAQRCCSITSNQSKVYNQRDRKQEVMLISASSAPRNSNSIATLSARWFQGG